MVDYLADQLLRDLLIKSTVSLMSVGLSATGVGLWGGLATWALGKLLSMGLDRRWDKQLENLWDQLEDDPDCTRDWDIPAIDPEWILDPSGFVYEAVESNRLPGVTTTIAQQNADGTWTIWDAEWYGQENPLLTDEEGRYAWDVPHGNWQVIYEMDEYETAYSEVLTVPPIHLDVNVGLLSLRDPAVEEVIPVERDGTRSIDVWFSQYMLADTLTTATIAVTEDGALLEGDVTPVDAVTAPDGTVLTRAARFTPSTPFAPEADYTVTVWAGVQNYRGWPMVESYTETVTMPADLTPPAAVTGVRVEPGDGQLMVSWTDPPDPDLDGVRVDWEAGGNSGSRTIPAGAGAVTLTGLTNGEIYRITLTAFDGAGNEADPVTVTGTPADVTPPGPVSDVGVTSLSPGEAGLTWRDPVDATSVRISWSGQTGPRRSTTVPAGVGGYVARDLTPLETYTFQLVAVDDSGNESAPVSAAFLAPDFAPPGDVTNLKVQPGSRQLTVTWTDPAVADLDVIRISWGTEGTFGTPVEVPAGAGKYTITGLQNGVEYDVLVVAVDTEGLESPGVTASGTPRAGSSGGSTPTEPEPEPEPGTEPEPGDESGTEPGDEPGDEPEPPEEPEPSTEPEPGESRVTLGDPGLTAEVRSGPAIPDRPGLRPIGPVYRIAGTPSSLPIGAAFPFDPSLLGGADACKLGIYRSEEDGSWTYVGGAVDPATSLIHGRLPGTGDYAVMLYDRTFADLAGHWSRADVEVLAAHHLVHGVTETEFQPDRMITRAEFTKLLMAMLGAAPAPLSVWLFTDVAPGAWYFDYVQTAATLGLVKGSEGRFRPDDPVTREEMAAMVIRALGLEERAAETEGPLPFTDAEAVSDWAKGYVALAVQEGLLQGMPDGTFQPGGTATRAQAAAVILRAMNYLGLVTR